MTVAPLVMARIAALVNEVYLNLVDARNVTWRDRAHFFAICARLMREILVHSARARDAQKRGGGLRQISPMSRLSSRRHRVRIYSISTTR